MTDIRKATLQEIPVINKMAAEVWPHTYSHMLSQEQLNFMFDMMYSFDSIKQQMTEKEHSYYILYENNTPQAYLSVHVVNDTILYLEKIYVLPTAQGKGFGNELLKKAEEEAKSLSLGSIRLNVNRDNKSHNFYTHCGFQIISERDLHIGNGFYMNDYIMEKIIFK